MRAAGGHVSAHRLLSLGSRALAPVLRAVAPRTGLQPRRELRAVFYHGIGNGDGPCMRYLHDELPRDTFAAHLDHLGSHYHMVSLEEALAGAGDASGAPPCWISFDDGLRSVYTDAFPLLRERRIPATIFINTAVIGNGDLLWQHLLNHLLSTCGGERVTAALARRLPAETPPPPAAPAALIEWCIREFALLYRQDLLRSAAAELGVDPRAVAAEQRLYLSWPELDEMAAAGVTFASHTARHAPLVALDEPERREELRQGRDAVAARDRTAARSVSFPFGMDYYYGRDTIGIAAALGHECFVEVGDGLNHRGRMADGMVSRVGLGRTPARARDLYAAIEIVPPVKHRLRRWLGRAA